ncbi:hypothetical Protein psc5_04870 [Candidatus Phytoplasma solani]
MKNKKQKIQTKNKIFTTLVVFMLRCLYLVLWLRLQIIFLKEKRTNPISKRNTNFRS